MPAKKPGDPVRILRAKGANAEIENDWAFVRFEPVSGDLIAEKDGKRVVCRRAEYLMLNFPGSAGVWEALSSEEGDPDLVQAKAAWKSFDLRKTLKCLLAHGRTLDPGFKGVQTVSDLLFKIRNLESACLSSMETLRLEAKRAQAEYDRAPIGASLDNDRKDTLLQRLCGIKDRLAAREHLYVRMLPTMHRVGDALKSLEEAASEKQ